MLERLNLSSLKGLNMSQVKSVGDSALKGISKLSKKRMSVAGHSVNPMLLGGAAALALGGYLVYRNRSKKTSNTEMQNQDHSVK